MELTAVHITQLIISSIHLIRGALINVFDVFNHVIWSYLIGLIYLLDMIQVLLKNNI